MVDVPSESYRPGGSTPIGPPQLLQLFLEGSAIVVDFCQPPKSSLDAHCSHHLFCESAAHRCHVGERTNRLRSSDSTYVSSAHVSMPGHTMWGSLNAGPAPGASSPRRIPGPGGVDRRAAGREDRVGMALRRTPSTPRPRRRSDPTGVARQELTTQITHPAPRYRALRGAHGRHRPRRRAPTTLGGFTRRPDPR